MRASTRVEVAAQPDRERARLQRGARLGRREGAAAGRDHGAVAGGQLERDRRRLGARKPSSPRVAEDLGDRSCRCAPRARGPCRRTPSPGAARPAGRRCVLPEPMKPDEHDARAAGLRLASRALRRRARAGRRTRGTRPPRTRRPRSRVSPSAPSAATASAIAMRWSPRERTAAPRSGRPPSTARPSGCSSTAAPMRCRPSARAAMRSLSLMRSSPAPAHARGALGERRGHRQRRHLVDERGHPLRRHVDALQPRRARHDPADRLRRRRLDGADSIAAAHGAQHVEERGAPGVQQDAVDAHLGVGQDEGGHDQEGGAGDVAGHRRRQRAAGARRPGPTPRAPSRSTARRRPAAGARCGRGWAAARARSCGPRPAGPRAGRPSSPARSATAQRRSSMPRRGPPSIVSGGLPSVVSTRAPIARSGSATRSTGRRRSDSSPVRMDRNGRPASDAGQHAQRRARVAGVEGAARRRQPARARAREPSTACALALGPRRPSASQAAQRRGAVGGGGEVARSGVVALGQRARGWRADGRWTCRRERETAAEVARAIEAREAGSYHARASAGPRLDLGDHVTVRPCNPDEDLRPRGRSSSTSPAASRCWRWSRPCSSTWRHPRASTRTAIHYMSVARARVGGERHQARQPAGRGQARARRVHARTRPRSRSGAGPGHRASIPGAVPNPVAPENLLKADGRGIFFMRNFMDDGLLLVPAQGRHGRPHAQEGGRALAGHAARRTASSALPRGPTSAAARVGRATPRRMRRSAGPQSDERRAPAAAAAHDVAERRDLAHLAVVVEVAGHPRRAPGAPGQHLAAVRGEEQRRGPTRAARAAGRGAGQEHQQAGGADAQEPQRAGGIGADARARSRATRSAPRRRAGTVQRPQRLALLRAAGPASSPPTQAASATSADERRRARPSRHRRPLRLRRAASAARPIADRERRQAGQDVAGQLRAGQREEDERQHEPAQHEEVGAATPRAAAAPGRAASRPDHGKSPARRTGR